MRISIVVTLVCVCCIELLVTVLTVGTVSWPRQHGADRQRSYPAAPRRRQSMPNPNPNPACQHGENMVLVSGWQAPEHLILWWIQLQPVGLHSQWHLMSADRENNGFSWTTNAVHLGVVYENKHSTWRREFLGRWSKKLKQFTHITTAAWHWIWTFQTTFKGISVLLHRSALVTQCLTMLLVSAFAAFLRGSCALQIALIIIIIIILMLFCWLVRWPIVLAGVLGYSVGCCVGW